MSSPAVEFNCIRTVPLIVDDGVQSMDAQQISGYPFDNSDDEFSSRLDDLTKRHPELAGHLGTFRQRANSRPNTAEEYEFRTRFDRPFGSSFERFGFPFDRDDFDTESYANHFHRPREEFYQQRTPSRQRQSSSTYEEQHPEPPHYHQAQQEEVPEPQHTDQAQGRSNLQQSNTTDLGQRQEPVNERNQRSMSAPPVDKGQRFNSTTNIPPQPPQYEKMSQPETKSNERIIPIHIEGRDEPVLPKNVPPSFSQPHPTFTSPQSERIFGQRPEQFTQFLNREPRQFGFTEEPARQQRYQQHGAPPHYGPREDVTIPVQRMHQETQQKRTASPHPPQQSQPQPQQQGKPSPQENKFLAAVQQIQAIQKSVSELMVRVQQFTGKPKDKEYLYLDEMLTRNLLKLDNIDTQGQENIRLARKESVKCVEKTITLLEAKAAANARPTKTEDRMEVEEKPQDTSVESKQPEVEQPKTEQHMDVQPVEDQPEIQQPSEPDVKSVAESMETVSESPANTQQEKDAVVTESASEGKIENTIPEQTDKQETCEGQESNMCVADAVKKFDVGNQDKSDDGSNTSAIATEEVVDEKSQENKVETGDGEEKVTETKDKQKSKRNVEKEEK